VFQLVAGWTIALGALSMAVACALNCCGLARGRLRTGEGMRINLGLGMLAAGIAGFFWAVPAGDGPIEPWRPYWLGLAAAGIVVFVSSEVRRAAEALWLRVRQGARIYTIRSEWRPKHFVVLGAVAASSYAMGFVPEDRWFYWVAIVLFVAVVDHLKTLPIHFGRRPPNPLGITGL
jgi:hypothetical protein